MTDRDGNFNLTYDDEAFQSAPERRPDLVLVVAAPDDAARRESSPILFASRQVRQNAGRHEEYVVRIGRKLLDRAGIDVDRLEGAPEAVAANISSLEARRVVVDHAVRAIEVEQVKVQRERIAAFDSTLKPALSRVSDQLKSDPGYVGPDDSPSVASVMRDWVADVRRGMAFVAMQDNLQSAMSPGFLRIGTWLNQQMRNPRSILNCM